MRRRALVVTGVAMAIALAACTGDEPATQPPLTLGTTPAADTPAPATTTPGVPGSAPPATVSPTPTPAPAPEDPPRWVEVASGFEAPVATLVDPRSGDLLVVQLPGRIARLDGTTVLDLTDRVTTGSERGLLDATTTPDGQRLLVHYSGDDGATTLSSFPVLAAGDDLLADRDRESVLLTIPQPAGNHNGGSLVFGPDDWLYLALGDGGGANDRFGNGDDLATPLGAILRLDVVSEPGVALPAPDNPYVDGGGDPRIWVSGVRNPWRITHDGTRWFVADVGQDAVEEVTVVPGDAGPHDLGWPSWEGDVCRLQPCDEDSLPPVHTLRHADGVCSVIGGAVAEAPAVDAGTYYFTDLCDPQVWRLDPATGSVVPDAALPSAALALDLDVDGSVVALTQSGTLYVRTR